jgi:hypothetical protein
VTATSGVAKNGLGCLNQRPSNPAILPERSDGFFEFLGGAKGDLLAGLDLDRLAGGGIAAHAGKHERAISGRKWAV